MEFYTSFNEKRPVRLCESTRRFAYESLYEHKYGKDTRNTPFIDITGVAGHTEISNLKKYDLAIRRISIESPIRICNGERISCAATLGDSIDHWVPVRINEQSVFLGISHLTIDFSETLEIGIDGIKKKVSDRLKSAKDSEIEFLESCLSSIESFRIWIGRYVDALKELDGYDDNLNNLLKVPFSPPTSFYEAVQCIWAVFSFCRLCGCWPGIGRIDMLLGKYLKKDLEDGTLTLCEAREILAHFFIKGCEWVAGGNYVSGDAQHYQNIVLSGCDAGDNDVTNQVTYLVLDIIEELGISDFPVSVRIGKNTNKELVRRVAEVMRYGNGIIAIYNEDTVIQALQNNGYSPDEARCFANDGCWEVMLPGQSYFTYFPFDALAILQKITMKDYSGDADFSSFDELFSCYLNDLSREVEAIYDGCIERLNNKGHLSYAWNESVPCTVISLFEHDCVEKALSYTDGGTRYTVYSPHLGGLSDVANSLYAIKKLVWDEKKITFTELTEILSRNWDGAEELRHHAVTAFEYYGNDNDEVDLIVKDILSYFADVCKKLQSRSFFRFPAGVSTFGRQIDWAHNRYALPSGQKANSVLANNMAPSPSTTFHGATAIINSYCKSELSRISNGAALDLRLFPNDVKGENGLSALCALIYAFCELGGFFVQIDVADSKILRDAQANPDKYPALSVRIAGWNARFVTLSKEWQDMIISNIDKK